MSEQNESVARELERDARRGGGLFYTARDPATGEVYRQPISPAQAAALIAHRERREED